MVEPILMPIVASFHGAMGRNDQLWGSREAEDGFERLIRQSETADNTAQ